ncbi:Peptidase family M28 [Ekhidna lutea]|uniref:Peptidase family M28 n=1 Tax=Ekhidna lutea TaxID=447679 RepID=A0A239EQE1_EKHLU|nr:M28 family peptidase [Ekhidna lutea]SNS46084.1 Peptidase family M28 [Ekhidna lutea]
MKKIYSLITVLFVPALLWAQTDKELAEQATNQAIIKSHIGFLASDELKGRDTPSEGLKIAAKYIESRFLEYGVNMGPGMESYMQPVPMKKVAPRKTAAIKVGKTELMLNTDFVVIDGDESVFDQPFYYAKYGMPDDLTKENIEGKVVFTICGDGESQNPQEWFTLSGEKRKKVKELGGLALIELYSSAQLPWNFLVRYLSREQVIINETSEEGSISHIWLNRSVEDVSFLDSKKPASIVIGESESENFISQNVVGYVEGTDPKLKDEFIVYSAHYDHVGIGQADANGDSIYNGSRDNAVGIVTVLSAAKSIAANPTKRSALFVLFTGEEKGLLGSKYFVDNAPIELSKMVYCFNSDNGGYNDTSKATIIGLGRTTADEMIIEACKAFGLEATDDPAPDQNLFDRSDNVRFAAKGIPAPTFGMGFTAFDAEITKYYHQPGDNPETLDYVYLEKFFRSYVYACRMIGNAKKAPFWVKGDKYYEAGKELYK